MNSFIRVTAGKGSFWTGSGNVGERFSELCFFSPEFGQVNKKNLYWKVPLKHGVWNESCLGVTSPESIRWLLSPSQLLQAPAPWLPYMRDQGLPRCSGERRAQCETGQPGPQNTHFLCVLGALVGFQMGSVTQATPHLFLMESVAFSRGLWAPSAFSSIISLSAKKVCSDCGCLSRVTSCRKGKSNSVHLSFLPKSSATEPRH